jgi:Protein of unknown function (DUF1569)
MRTLFDDACRTDVLARLRHVRPDTRPSWGRMTAPQMVVHLADQMRMTLGNARWTRMPPAHLRWPGMKQAALYWLPWPKGAIQGPPEVFVTTPTDWDADIATVEALVARFAARGPGGAWPEHSHFGRLNGRQWGVFCYRHFDHHLTQFGA